MSREQPGEMLGRGSSSACGIAGWPVTVERIGLEFFYQRVEGHELHIYDQPSVIEFALKGRRIELTPDYSATGCTRGLGRRSPSVSTPFRSRCGRGSHHSTIASGQAVRTRSCR